MHRRQLINLARPTTSSAPPRPQCTPFTLPSNGVLTLGVSSVITLTSDAVFTPECTGSSDVLLTNGNGSPQSFKDLRDPFYASIIPECYALASATVIAYMLVIMLFITPRTFLHDGMIILGRRGFTNGPSGSDTAGVGIGGRPWLQKVAAMTVAISLTIATADSFRVAEQQYEMGLMDATALQTEVEDGMELKIIRVISDTFLWLAQAQTLIRLFPRQREKIIIKWTAFALITLDTLFSILNNFVYNGNSRPRSFVDAIPALAYLFQLALSLLYSAWVIYYALTKKRYAFYHPKMKNICLVALLSLVAVLVPTVFFVLDISQPTLAGWGDYVRWVGAAAASVVVWEWVERIEALERNDKKDGVLGREVFDGDEMLEITPSSDSGLGRRRGQNDDGGGGNGVTTGSNGVSWPAMAGIASRYRPRASALREFERTNNRNKPLRKATKRIARARPPLWPTRPPPALTPVSRTDTTSAESTVYAVRYHPISESTPPAREAERSSDVPGTDSIEVTGAPIINQVGVPDPNKPVTIEQMEEVQEGPGARQRPNILRNLANANLFRRKVQGPPLEVSAHTTRPEEPVNSHEPTYGWDIRRRFGEFAATQADRYHDNARPKVSAAPLPVTVIPAPPRRHNLQATLEELESAERGEMPQNDPGSRYIPSIGHSRTYPDEPSRSQRLSDTYTSNSVNRQSIHQRGAVSFVTTERDRQAEAEEAPLSSMSGDRDGSGPLPSHSSTSRARTPASPLRDGLPVVSIPAPPRRPRPPDDG
ncbi:PalH [Venustampulla echinocandica]|uniref:PalH n=1 Tax=Venustampulla echinocandica TaxID=2656787 RepID=A0A370TVX5_9HELO|nr:PalH [Venustampulla echinocandica]RDL39681.1 PalH [Venustampulla echinocandica]